MSKIEKTDSWASWAGRLWTFIFGNKTLSAGLAMSFASSFLAPIKSTIGLSSTVIFITGLGAIIFLSISLLWMLFLEKKNSNEIKKEKEKLDMEYGNEIRKEMIAISDKKTTGELTFEQSKEMIERRIAATTDEIKKGLLPIMKVFCDGNKNEYSKDEYDKFYLLWKNFQPFQENIMRLLLYKAAPKITTGEISRQAIEFLKSITDNDLEILKRQFRYVLRLPHLDVSQDLGIYNYELSKDDNLQNILMRENGLIHLESCSMRFHGDVWIGENGTRSSYYKINGFHVISDIDSKKCWNLQIEIKAENPKEQQISFHSYTCLSQIGMEIFNLLKDELEPISSEYLNKLVAYWVKIYPAITFKLMEKTQLLENDNT